MSREAEDSAESDCHITVSREVEVYLERNRDCRRPCHQHGMTRGGIVKLHKACKRICQKYFLSQSDAEPDRSAGKALKADSPFLKLGGNRPVSYDRSRDKLRKKRHISGEIYEIPLCLYVSAIHIDRVAYGLEGIEADTYGKCDLQKRHFTAGQHIEAVDKQVGILEIAEERKIYE